MALEQMRYLREEGVDLHHVSFGHMDRNPDSYMHLKIADTGAFLCFDGIAKVKYNPESTRIQCILELVKHGYQKQILVSGDTARRSYYRSYSHAVGLPYIKETWVPRLIEEAENRGFNGDVYKRQVQQYQEFKWNVENNYKDQVDVTYVESDNDITKQISNIEDLIAQDVDVIITTPCDTTALNSTLQEAMDEGIKVILLAATIEGDSYDSLITVDEKEFGAAGAEWLARCV